MRNWIIGFYIVEYEQHGNDRAVYGQRLYKEIAANLKNGGITSLRERHLYFCEDFYKAYSDILRTVSAKFYLSDSQGVRILRLLSAKSIGTQSEASGTDNKSVSNLLLERLSFSHFIELLKLDTALKREFYEVETIKNSWSVRDLQRAMNSMLYERTGLSINKHAVLNNEVKQAELKAENIFRNAYMLEF